MNAKFLVLILSILFFNTLLIAQKPYDILEVGDIKFEKIKSDEGLFHNSITTIFQDSKGYMWFGSFNGLYKYDGYRFQIYKNDIDNDTSIIGNDRAKSYFFKYFSFKKNLIIS